MSTVTHVFLILHSFTCVMLCCFTSQVDSPFVVNLYYAFQTADKLCFILDLMNGN